MAICGCGSNDAHRVGPDGGGGEAFGGAGSPTSLDAGAGGSVSMDQGGAPQSNEAGAGGADEGGAAPMPPGCAPPGAIIEHSTRVEADETWGPGLHDVTFEILVHNDATLIIEPCAVVRMLDSQGLQVKDGGRIVARGNARQPIVFEGKNGASWGDLEVDSGGFVDLAYVTIRGGGDLESTGESGAALRLIGDFDLPLQPLARVDHVSLTDARRFGAVLELRGAFTDDSRELTVNGAGEMALWASASTLGSIPSGDYTGNATDAIRIRTDTYVDADVTIHDRGVPYWVGGDGASSQLRVHGKDDALAVLTIEPGVTLAFPKTDRDSALYVQHSSNDPVDAPAGALVAVGTQSKPIVFTSSEAAPAAGDWIGVWFDAFDDQDRMEYVRVEYAGGETGTDSFSCGTPQAPVPSGNRAAIGIFAEPSYEFVTHTTISDSAWNAFERGWTNGRAIDFRPTNSFEKIRYCAQTYPRQQGTNAQCPASCDAP